MSCNRSIVYKLHYGISIVTTPCSFSPSSFKTHIFGCLQSTFSTQKKPSVNFSHLCEQMIHCKFFSPAKSKSTCAKDFNSMIIYSCPLWGISLIFSEIKKEVNSSTSVNASNYSLLLKCSFKAETAHFLKKLYPSTKCYFSPYISNRRFPTFCPLLPHRFNV